jgi:secretion/DNA translocation related TadE-like protein
VNPWQRSDRGSATIWSLSIIVTLTAAMMLALALAAAVIQRHRATSAADLAALAGAGQVLAGPVAACGRAAEIARRHAAALERCDVVATSVAVEVSLPHDLGWLGRQVLAPARGRARAGVGP